MASASRGPTAPRGAESSAPPAPAYGRCLPWVGSQASRMSKSWTLCPRSPGQHEDKISALGSLAPPEQDRQGGAPEPPIEQVLQAHGRHRARRLVLTGSRDRGREPPAGGPRAGGLGTRVGARQRRPQRQPQHSTCRVAVVNAHRSLSLCLPGDSHPTGCLQRSKRWPRAARGGLGTQVLH